jgi:DNA-binding MarR family transcriptional regulator
MKKPTNEEAYLFIQTPKRFVHTIMYDLKPPEESKINMTQLRALFVLREHGDLSMKELGNRIGMTKGSLTQVVDRLVDIDFAVRKRSSEDRRQVKVSITELGLNITSQADKRFENHIFENIQLLDDKEATELLNALKTLRRVSATIEEKKHAKSG